MTNGELQSAVRRALNDFDEWVDVVGWMRPGESYYYEMQRCITNAVHFGAQAATGDYRRLEDETAIVPEVRAAIKAGKLTRDGKRRKKVGSHGNHASTQSSGSAQSAAP